MHRSSESIAALAAALAKAQVELTNPEKSLTATLPADPRDFRTVQTRSRHRGTRSDSETIPNLRSQGRLLCWPLARRPVPKARHSLRAIDALQKRLLS